MEHSVVVSLLPGGARRCPYTRAFRRYARLNEAVERPFFPGYLFDDFACTVLSIEPRDRVCPLLECMQRGEDGGAVGEHCGGVSSAEEGHPMFACIRRQPDHHFAGTDKGNHSMTQSSPFTISTRPRSGQSGRSARSDAAPCSGEPPLPGEPPFPGEPPHPLASESPPDLPGCEPFPMTEDQAATYEGRIEVWDARTRTAWRVAAPTTTYHERPTRGLSGLAERIASVRGSPIVCYGSSDLVQRDAAGRWRWLVQADEVLYVHPRRALPTGARVEVDVDALPDVVLEVDHTTDVRRWKLGKYMEWGFPELWVLVPWGWSVRAPGLTIHVRGEGGGYRESEESVAFAGWRAEEIHRALTEEPVTGETWRALERVGRAMGMREGTRPEDDPLTRSLSAGARAKGRAAGRAEGHAEGHAEGRAEGRAEGHAEMVRAVLHARGVPTGADFAADPERFAGASPETLMAAAQACTDEADFR